MSAQRSKGRQILFPIMVAAILVPLAGQSVVAAPKRSATYWIDVTIRGQAGDIVLGDRGPNSLYVGGESNSKIGDLAKLNELGYADAAILLFDERYDSGRYIEIQSADISPTPVRCTTAQIYVFSRSVPHWFNEGTTAGAGYSAVGDGNIACLTSLGQAQSGSGWYISYSDFGSECLSIENLGDTNGNGRPEWRFSSQSTSPQCVAHVWSLETSNKGSTKTHVAHSYPGLFEVTTELR